MYSCKQFFGVILHIHVHLVYNKITFFAASALFILIDDPVYIDTWASVKSVWNFPFRILKGCRSKFL